MQRYDCQTNAHGPPDETNLRRVFRRLGLLDGKIPPLHPNSGKNDWERAKRCTEEHGCQVTTGGQETPKLETSR